MCNYFELHWWQRDPEEEPMKLEVQLTEKTKITDGKKEIELAGGEVVTVFLEKGDAKVAASVEPGNM